MKNLKAFATLFFSMLVLFASPCSLRTFAAETDALEITITADKENYSTGDTVKLNVNVKNNNSYTIDSLSLEGSISDNFTISENKNYSMKLEPSESKDYTITAKQNNQDSPQTGVTPPIIPAVLLGASLIFVTFTLIKNKKARKMLAVVLCVTSISGFCFDKSSFKAIAAEYITVTKESTFKYNNKDITAKITAKYEDMGIIVVNTAPLGEKLDDGSYNVTEVISTLDGTLKNSDTIKDFSYKVTDMKNAVVLEGKLNPAEKWTIENFGLVIGGNNVVLTAVDNDNKTYTTKLIVFNSNVENMNNTNVDLSDDDNDMLLSSEITEFLGNSGNKTIIFYLMTNATVSSIPLINSDTNEVIATLVDDGKYSVSGDDMTGDGIYSGKYTLNTNVEDDMVYYFHAETDQVVSNEVAITITIPFTSQELSDMEYVQNSISDVLKKHATPEQYLQVPYEYLQNNADFDYCALFEERCAALTDVLSLLQNEGKINSYHYDDINKIFNCEYSNSIPFIIVPTDLLETVTYEDELLLPSENEYSGYNAVVLNTFENNKFRTKFYEKFTDKWIDKGMTVDYDDEVTVADLATKLSNKDIICLSGHGLISGGRSAFCLSDEAVTPTTTAAYALDISNTRIESVTYSDGTTSYIIYDTFITHHYGSGLLSGAFVFSESCTFMGSHDNVGYDETFANAFINSDAEAVIGFENSVMAVYSRDLMLSYFEELLNGKNVNEAFKTAKDKHDYNDYEYREPSFIEYLFDKDAFEKMGETAFPHMVGNGDAVLTKELKNGNWECLEQASTSTPYGWGYSGDARVLTQLGKIAPYNSRMAFLSTGIGSNSGVTMSGSQGSTLFQTIKNTNKTSLEFSYNFISEEPTEFIDSKFDDKFEIQILDTDDNVLHSEILETINTSKWHSVSGINFDGGDSTVYHTNWQTASIDISPYKNQTIKIMFLVYDVGDSAYDTAVVLDNIACN